MYEFACVLLRSRKLSSRTLSTSTTVFSPAPEESEPTGPGASGVSGVWFGPVPVRGDTEFRGLLGEHVVVELTGQVVDLGVIDHGACTVATVTGLEVRACRGVRAEGPRDWRRNPDLGVRADSAQRELLAVEPGAVVQREPGPRGADRRRGGHERAALVQRPQVLPDPRLLCLQPLRLADSLLHRHDLVRAHLHRDARVAPQVPARLDDAVVTHADALDGSDRLLRSSRAADGKADRSDQRKRRRNDERARRKAACTAPSSWTHYVFSPFPRIEGR